MAHMSNAYTLTSTDFGLHEYKHTYEYRFGLLNMHAHMCMYILTSTDFRATKHGLEYTYVTDVGVAKHGLEYTYKYKFWGC